MKTLVLFLYGIIFSVNAAFASECFIAEENGRVLVEDVKKKGDCATAHAPESTFKILLSLIGFDSEILENANAPQWDLPEGVDPYISVCKGEQTPGSWILNSCAWFSRILLTKLGIEKLQNYVKELRYGNMDLSGGLLKAWLSSSLQISPKGQVEFLQKIVNRDLPISDASYDYTKQIMFIQEMAGGWKLYGKTGNGRQLDKNGKKTALQHGWFVGYIEKGNRRIVFANHIADKVKHSTFASFRARNEALTKLWYLVDKHNER